MITLEKVNKYFNKGKKNQIHVINDTSLKLPDQGLVALIGESGCGKTTLLNVSGGLDNQIKTIKEQYKTSFEQPKVVSTGQSVQTSNTVKTGRVYSSLAEIAGLTQAEVDADLENITSQLPNLK